VLLLSQYVRPTYAIELLADDARGVGYLLKDRMSDLDELSDAVRRIGDGGSVLDPVVVSQLVRRSRDESDPLEELSEREQQVLALMAEGRSNRAIADRLVVTERTVEKHVNSILMKLGIPPRADDNRRVLAVLAYLGA
jgi:DNA-binding NarL/FixJ family response regulator